MNTITNNLIRLCSLLLFFTVGSLAYAGPGHDHGEEKTAVHSTIMKPKFYMESELYEVVGTIDGKNIVIFIDDYLTNRKVSEAELTLNVDDQAIKLVKAVNDTYQGNLSSPVEKKSLSITLSVKDKDVDDILITTYDPTDHDVLKIFRWWYWSLWLISSMTLIAMLFIGFREKQRLITAYKKLINFIKERK